MESMISTIVVYINDFFGYYYDLVCCLLMFGFGVGPIFLSVVIPYKKEKLKGLILCPFKMITGFDCPFCGMTRAFVCIGHCDFISAVKYNPASPFVYLIFIWIGLVSAKAIFIDGEYHELPSLRLGHPWLEWLFLFPLLSIFIYLYAKRILYDFIYKTLTNSNYTHTTIKQV